MMMKAQINLAVIDQVKDIAAVLKQAFWEYEHLYTPEAFAATTPTDEQIANRWNEGPVWVAIQDNEIIGTVAAVPKDMSLYVRSMAVLPSARGLGTGLSLLQAVEQFATQNGNQRMFLSTTPFLDRAIRLYEKFGFQKTEDGPHNLFGTPLFTMQKLMNKVTKENHEN